MAVDLLTNPEIALEFHIMFINSHLLCLYDGVLNVFRSFLEAETQLLVRLLHRHAPDEGCNVPEFLGTVLDVGLGMADILEGNKAGVIQGFALN